ncbi:MAG: hypothetical protein EA362_06480 [Saprospirales bacterium]|nr:MAG: hypothetical protein EA362_06480 [Saprospirales bacterium]
MKHYLNLVYFAFFTSVLILFSACDEKEVLIPDFVLPDSDRVVVIEELTGVRCPNCPGGSRELKRIQEQFGDNVAIVGIHSNILANPFPNSKYDFRAPFNDQIQDYLGLPIGKPSAYINRRFFSNENNRAIPTVGSWAGYVAQELESFATLEIDASHNFNPESRELDISLIINAKSLLEGRYQLTVYLTESGIIDPQLDQTVGVIEEYVHNFVLREVLTNVTGDVLPDVLNPDQPINRAFNFTIPEEDGWWNVSNMNAIAFVTSYDVENPDIREIIQAVQFSLL